MKKTIFAVMLAIMLAAGSAFAAGPGGQVSGTYIAQAFDQPVFGKSSYTCTGEYAHTAGSISGEAYNYNSAYGPFAKQAGYATLNGKINSYACTWDSGKASGSFAQSTVSANALAGGGSFSLFGKGASSYSSTWVGGTAYQNNGASESGYSAGYAVGSNESHANFYNQGCSASFGGKYLAGSISAVDGSATTSGFTNVSIDPTGDNRSAFAETGNMAAGNAGVGGQGGVNTYISKGGVVAQGGSGFAYSAPNATYGSGYAVNNSTVSVGQGSFKATSYGFSATSVKGSSNQMPR